MPKLSPYNYCLYLLAKREYSSMELQKKLQQRQVDDHTIELCIEKLQEHQLQSDERFCDSMIRYYSEQLKGPALIKSNLLQAGVDTPLISQRLEYCQINWLEKLQILINKKWGEPTSTIGWTEHQKQIRYLLNRGYSYDQINECLPRPA